MKRAIVIACVLAVLCSSVGAWQFFFAEDLLRTIQDQVDTEVFVVDRVVQVWENDSDRHRNFGALPIGEYWRFDTEHFSCVISEDNSPAIEKVRAIFADSQKLVDDDGKVRYDVRPPLVAIKGTIMQAELWGHRDEDTTRTWYVLVVDDIETPRERFFTDAREGRRP